MILHKKQDMLRNMNKRKHITGRNEPYDYRRKIKILYNFISRQQPERQSQVISILMIFGRGENQVQKNQPKKGEKKRNT